ncbi:PREDICTED: uncharacterized protein LOC102847656 [Elephantulus edwardii]|uniref:uncharacterized protein LOC102847656 n=1 Tax=Elephantulus edwardii TaxID=28737 RepID=UPI0003F0ECAC|nr:PREDICTED: uncharacterized protein LOC102847656 [Elephantulus edwardii]
MGNNYSHKATKGSKRAHKEKPGEVEKPPNVEKPPGVDKAQQTQQFRTHSKQKKSRIPCVNMGRPGFSTARNKKVCRGSPAHGKNLGAKTQTKIVLLFPLGKRHPSTRAAAGYRSRATRVGEGANGPLEGMPGSSSTMRGAGDSAERRDNCARSDAQRALELKIVFLLLLDARPQEEEPRAAGGAGDGAEGGARAGNGPSAGSGAGPFKASQSWQRLSDHLLAKIKVECEARVEEELLQQPRCPRQHS